MKGKMKVAVMVAPGQMEYAERDIPHVKSDEVLIRIEYAGICSGDLHYYEFGRIADLIAKPPFVLGHEAGGVVVDTGRDVKHLKPGDKVALEPGKACGHCEFCLTGRYNLCNDLIFFATPPMDGVFREYTAYKAALCFKLPDNVGTMEGALIEPLAVGFHAARQGGAQAGQTAVVTGSGCIGIMSMLALRAMGVSRVYITDVEQSRLDKAKELGATKAINSAKEEAVQAVHSLTGGGCDLVIETAGSQFTAAQAIQMAKKGATIVFVGYSKTGMMDLPMSAAIDKELTFKTVFRCRHTYPVAIEAVASGAVDVKSIVTKEFDFSDIQNAMEQSLKNKADIVKAVIKI